mmetsp:Transcript_15431/g.50221  ORF Transcript_15431/g.50221 Transcript_15431/m.50221 type:complete len:279 (+) Transcript_15431:434-1270(+)
MDSNNLRCPSGGLWHSTQIRDLSVPECDSGAQREVWEVWLFLAADRQIERGGRVGVRRVERLHLHGRQVGGGGRILVAHDHSLGVEPLLHLEHVAVFAGPRTPPSLVAPQHEPLAAAGNHAPQQRVLGRRVRYLYHRRNDDAPVRRPRGGDPGARLLQPLQVCHRHVAHRRRRRSGCATRSRTSGRPRGMTSPSATRPQRTGTCLPTARRRASCPAAAARGRRAAARSGSYRFESCSRAAGPRPCARHRTSPSRSKPPRSAARRPPPSCTAPPARSGA